MHTGFGWESQKERHQLEDPDVGGRIILKWILIGWGGMDWIHLAEDISVGLLLTR
jgi:hypothetical protein